MAGDRQGAAAGPVTVSRALREFLSTEVVGGAVLVAAAAIAMVWANSAWSPSYERLWQTEVSLHLGGWSLAMDLRHAVNEGLMTIFFVVVGLEVKRELFEGELRDPRRAALPVIAAVGGMVLPAGIYLLVNVGGTGVRGWGIPMATDIAFALGVVALVGRGLPSSLRLFLLTLAIVDDIGAIVVIGVFYSGGLHARWLAAALLALIAGYALRQAGVVWTPLFVALGGGLWLCVHESGLHATLAGVGMGLLAPVRPSLSRAIIRSRADELLDVFSPEAARSTSRLARLSVSQVEWLLHGLHPWTSLLIVPLFALANAGVPLRGSAISDAATSPVTWGVALGLVVGKTVGISAFAALACRLRLASLPSGVRWPQLVGTSALGGIGFTVSLFVTGLAFSDAARLDAARVGIVAASLVASALGGLILVLSRRSEGAAS